MVGVPSSKGCSTCRTRSIKCDEAQPSCYQCRRGGRKCPGYRRDLKFVDESAKLQDKVDGKRDESSTPKSSATSVRGPTLAPHNSILAQRNSVQVVSRELDNQISRRSSAKPDVRSPAVPKLGIRMSSRYLEQEGIVASFIQDIFPLGRSTVQLSFIGSWLWHVPEVLQKNHAMDFAAEALALVYFAKKANSMDTLVRSHWAYANALRDLSRALQDHSSRFASETLCATLLLVHYENFVEIPGTSWIAHAGGASRLIQLRGPDRHRSGFDCAMFMASRGYLISEAIATNERCFLEDDKWRCIQVDNISFPLLPDNCAIYHEGLNHFAIIPGLLKSVKDMTKDDLSIRRGSIYSAVKGIHSNMTEWYKKLQSEFEAPIRISLPVSPGAYTMFPSVYEYRDVLTATFVVNFSAYLLQLNNMLDILECSEERLEKNTALSRDICMSAAYCSKAGFCGIQAMVFALPFALSALPERYAGWIHHEIKTFTDVQESAKLRSTMLDESGSI